MNKLGSWELRQDGSVVAILAGTYLNWPWMECSVVIPGDASVLEVFFSFTARGRSGELVVLSPEWETQRLSLLARGYELHSASGASGVIGTELDIMLGLHRDGSGAFRPSSTPNVRNCSRDVTR